MHPYRHVEMVGVQQKIQEEFINFKDFCSSSLNRLTPLKENEDSFLFQLLQTRVDNRTPLLKAYFTRKVYDYLAEQPYQATTSKVYAQILPFASEVIMTLQYYSNQILDQKAGIDTTQKAGNNLLIKDLLEYQFYEYIERVLPKEASYSVIKAVRKIQQVVNWGQFTEKQNNLYSNYVHNQFGLKWNRELLNLVDRKALEAVKKHCFEVAPELKNCSVFLDWYLKRIFFTGAFTYVGIVQMISALMGKQLLNHQNFVHFTGVYGMMMQIVNDITDLVISEYNQDLATKHRTDALSDVKTQNVTLPLLIHLENQSDGSLREKLTMGSPKLTEHEEVIILRELFSTGSINKAIDIGKALAHYARTLLDTMPKNPNTALLKDMCNIADFNQPYKKLAELERRLR